MLIAYVNRLAYNHASFAKFINKKKIYSKNKEYFSISGISPSPDHTLIAYGEDLSGRREFNLKIKDLSSNKINFFQLRLKNLSQKKLLNISKKIKKVAIDAVM